MANEITMNSFMRATSGAQDEEMALSDTADMSTIGGVRNIQTVGTSMEALVLGDVGTPGFAMFKNLDATNYVEVGIDVGGFQGFLKLKAGEVAGPLRLTTTAPQARANTASVKLLYWILPN